MGASSFERVQSHLQHYGERTPMRLDQIDDLEKVAARLDEVRRRPEFAHIKLSSYMETLLGVTREAIAVTEPIMEERLAVSV